MARDTGANARFVGGVDDAERDLWLDRARVLHAQPPARGRFAGEGSASFLEAGLHESPVVAGDVGGACDAVAQGGPDCWWTRPTTWRLLTR